MTLNRIGENAFAVVVLLSFFYFIYLSMKDGKFKEKLKNFMSGDNGNKWRK